MPGVPKKLNHPVISYLIGAFFLVLTLAVFLGVMHHLTISHRGPGLLRPLLERYQERQRSEIVAETQRLAGAEQHRHFHRVAPEYPQLPEKLRPVCFICHSELPHRKHKRLRSLMNLHTQFFVCETCHIEDKPQTTIVYKWYNPLESDPSGPFYGTRYDPLTGSLSPGEDQIARIAPFIESETDNSLKPALKVQDAPLARDYMKVRDELNPEQREAIKNRFHENIKPVGHECRKCHSENSMLDFNALGFSQNRAANLQKLAVVGMIEKYERFYLPEIFPETASQGAEKSEERSSE